MSISSLPSRPDMPHYPGENASTDAKKAYDEKMLKYQEDMATYNRTLQQMMNMLNQEETTQSNINKSRHEAMMSIINNMRG